MFAKGRFLMMGTVVALVSFLVIVLSGMSSGLVKANISGLMALPATHISFEWTDHPSYRNTMVERYMWEGWQQADGVKIAEPLGHTVFNARTESGKPIEIALWGLVPDSIVEPTVSDGQQLGGVENGVIISRDLLDDGVKIGDVIILDRVLTELVVIGIVNESRNIGHLPIIYAPLRKWQESTYGPPGGPPPGEQLPDIVFDFVSVVMLQLEDGVDTAALDDEHETITMNREEYYAASTGFTSEVRSVQMIQTLLFIISAVVIGAFFSIWTIQRTKEIGLVKALGASNGYVLRDALGQAFLLIAAGILVGTAFALVFKQRVANTELPFMLEVDTLTGAMIALMIAGLVGAVMAVKRITQIDPIIALGARAVAGTNMTKSLKAENVTLLLGDGDQQVKALDDVSVEVDAGELVVVLGPSGAGKSSLLAVCGGLRTPTSGAISIDGQNINHARGSEQTRIRRERIGFVFQQSNLVPSLTALDQLLLLAHLRGRRPNAEDRAKAMALLDEVGVASKADRRPNDMSGGERQRVGIARAFMSDPKILLVDEPTSMLDRGRGHQIVELLRRECHDHNVATLMVTHDHSVLDLADRVVEISDGRLGTWNDEEAAAVASA